MNRLLKYINVLTAQAIVFGVFVFLLARLQFVISAAESQLKHEQARAEHLESYLSALEKASFLQKQETTTSTTGKPDSSVIKKVDSRNIKVPKLDKPVLTKGIDSPKKALVTPDTSNKKMLPIPVKTDPVKRTFTFSGGSDEPIIINKLLSIVKVELMLAVTSYDSIYQYTRYLGLTKWKLAFSQRRKGQSSDAVSVFRISKAKVENNQQVTCEFVEELPDHAFNQAARIVNFKGTITSTEIAGELSWIDRSDGGMKPLKILVQLKRAGD